MAEDLHVLFGAGQVGTLLAQQLVREGKRVRVAKRAPKGMAPGIEAVVGDALDPAFCLRAAEGARTLYHCMNPPYDTAVWAATLPRLMDNLIAAAARIKARLVVLDNVYMLGRPNGRALNEDSPVQPCSRKGEIRARVAETLFAAHQRGDVLATSGRASDFYGPGAVASFMGDWYWPATLAGKPVRLPIDPDAVHSYHYTPDVAAGLAALGCADDDAYGRPWMLPCEPAPTLRALTQRCSQQLGRDIRLAPLPIWMLKTAGVFMPLMRELIEMRYQWDAPFVVDDSRFRARFGLQPTPAEPAAAATVAWARRHYAAGA